METRARRIVQILENEVLAICKDADLACDDFNCLLEGLENHDEAIRNLSAPVTEALRGLLALRRDMLAVRVLKRTAVQVGGKCPDG